MHTQPMGDHEGDFGEYEKSDRPCPKCKSAEQHFVRLWESHCGGYEDEKHECRACHYTWWVEGPDS